VLGRHGNLKRHLVRHHGDVITVHDVSGNYTLIGQTYFHPSELRFHELSLKDDQQIAFRQGDVLGLQFLRYNPVAWSAVPCANSAQHCLVSRRVTSEPSRLGTTLMFDVEDGLYYNNCRQYSFTAVLSQCRFLLRFYANNMTE